MVDQPRLQLLEEDTDRIRYRARSWSAPATFHLVALIKATGEYTCSCKGFEHHHHCHHIPGWTYQESAVSGPATKRKRVRTPIEGEEGPILSRTLAPVPPLYRDVIQDWEDHRAVCEELLKHDDTWRRAVARADVNVMAARMWRIMFNIRVIPPEGMSLQEALHNAPPTSSLARWGRYFRAEGLLDRVDAEEQQRRAQGVKLAMQSGGGQATFLVEP